MGKVRLSFRDERDVTTSMLPAHAGWRWLVNEGDADADSVKVSGEGCMLGFTPNSTAKRVLRILKIAAGGRCPVYIVVTSAAGRITATWPADNRRRFFGVEAGP